MRGAQAKFSEASYVSPTKENICAVIVTYFPDAHFDERLARIRIQVAKTIIVDNTGAALPDAFSERMNQTDIEFIRNDENLGIGMALNQGLARAIQLGYPWAITFDQDSWVRPDLVKALISVCHQQPCPELIGIIGCNFEDQNIHKSLRKYKTGDPTFSEVEVVITSGSLMPTAVFSIAGPFRADLFIDFVDNEYCLRLRKLHYRVIMAMAPLMIHALGAATSVSLDIWIRKIPFVLTNRSSLRRYYLTRNALLVARRYFTIAPKWVLGSLTRVFVFAPLKIPFERNARWKKLCATAYGAFDALRSKTGKASAAWLEE